MYLNDLFFGFGNLSSSKPANIIPLIFQPMTEETPNQTSSFCYQSRGKYMPSDEEINLLVPALFEYFSHEDERSARRNAITKKLATELNQRGYTHWKASRTVRLWFNNNKDKYMELEDAKAKEKNASFEKNDDMLINIPQETEPLHPISRKKARILKPSKVARITNPEVFANIAPQFQDQNSDMSGNEGKKKKYYNTDSPDDDDENGDLRGKYLTEEEKQMRKLSKREKLKQRQREKTTQRQRDQIMENLMNLQVRYNQIYFNENTNLDPYEQEKLKQLQLLIDNKATNIFRKPRVSKIPIPDIHIKQSNPLPLPVTQQNSQPQVNPEPVQDKQPVSNSFLSPSETTNELSPTTPSEIPPMTPSEIPLSFSTLSPLDSFGRTFSTLGGFSEGVSRTESLKLPAGSPDPLLTIMSPPNILNMQSPNPIQSPNQLQSPQIIIPNQTDQLSPLKMLSQTENSESSKKQENSLRVESQPFNELQLSSESSSQASRTQSSTTNDLLLISPSPIAPIIVDFNKTTKKSEEISRKPSSSGESIDFTPKTTLTYQQTREERRKFRGQMINHITEAHKIAEQDISPEERLSLQIQLSEDVTMLHDYATSNNIYPPGKIPQISNDEPTIRIKSDSIDRTTSSTTKQLIKEETANREKEEEQSIASVPFDAPYSEEQKRFLSGEYVSSAFSLDSIEVITSYDGGVIFVRFDKSYSSIVKKEVVTKKKAIVCGNKTGFFARSIAIKVSNELNMVFVVGDRRIKAFDLEKLTILKTYALDDIYQKAFIEIYNSQLVVACSNETESKLFIFNIDAEEPTDPIQINEKNEYDPQYVSGSSGAPSLLQTNLQFHANSLKTCGEFLVLSYENQLFASVFGPSFKEFTRAVSHTEEIICLEALDDSTFITSSRDKSLRLWDVKTSTPKLVITGFDSPNQSMEIADVHGLTILFAATSNGPIQVFDMQKTRQLFYITNETGQYDFVHFFDNILISGQSKSGTGSVVKNYKITLVLF